MHNGYYRCSGCAILNGQQINSKPLHQIVAMLMDPKIPKGYTIDHINRDKEDNQRPNIRAASKRLQTYNTNIDETNTSGCIGVSFKSDCKTRPWVAQICLESGNIHLGCFHTKELASEAYQQAKLKRDKKEEEKCKAEIAKCQRMAD